MSEGEVSWSELSEGSEFAGYRIERRLGRGGMGIVYLAVEPGLDRRVALKLVAPDVGAEDVFRERFTHESRIAASIEHPNVVPIYAAGEVDGIPYIAMRFVSGSDLNRRLISAGRLEPQRAAALIAQVASGLDAIHAAGLVHRDVKPANVLLSGPEGSEHAYITDFGVARNVASTSGLTKTGRFVGTLDYVAPEQIRGREVDARADVYALGCLLFKILTGEVPFPRDGEAARLYAHLNDDPPAASLFTPLVPKALDRVISRAMAKNPDDRFPSAGDLGRAATAAVSGAEVALPERTVATGMAATRTAETPSEGAGATGAAATAPLEATRETNAAPTQRVSEDSTKPPGRRRLALLVGAIAAVAIAAGAIALGSGGGGGGDDSTAGAQGRQGKPQQRKPQKETLTAARLNAKAGEICLNSQVEFTAARDQYPNGETDINEAKPFARRLTQISEKALRGLRRLVPPPGAAKPYAAYVEARKRVHQYDIEAYGAAVRGDLEGFQGARQKNTDEGPMRHELAKKAGLTPQCSPIPNPQG